MTGNTDTISDFYLLDYSSTKSSGEKKSYFLRDVKESGNQCNLENV